MDEETKSKMFDPFFTTKFTGRGLGLSAVLGIVHGHKGLLTVDTVPGRGTTFKIFLPVPIETRALPVASAAVSSSARGTGTILVVDDEELVLRVAQTALSRAGYRALTAANGQQALEVFRAHRDEIILIILDLTMPVMGGAETLNQLCQLGCTVPVIGSSGYDESAASKHFGGGVAGFLQKPYKAHFLTYKVSMILQQADGASA